jgi:transcriptional regulator of acetoin/glycerol metabolism
MPISPQDRQSRLADARNRFSDGASIPTGLLSPGLLRSWERSREAGVSPSDRRLTEFGISRMARTTVMEENVTLIRRARPEMELIWRNLASPDWTILCTDRHGTIVDSLNVGSAISPELAGLVPGRSINESAVGTTAPTCALHELSPSLITANQHYLSELEKFFCAAVPVMSPHGDVIAALDITAINAQPDPWLLKQLRLARLSLENSYLLDLEGYRFFTLSPDPRFLSTPLEGIVAISSDGRHMFANSSARGMLALQSGYGTLKDVAACEYIILALSRMVWPTQNLEPSLIILNGRAVYALPLLQSQGRKPPLSRLPSRVEDFGHRGYLGLDSLLVENYRIAQQLFEGKVPILIQGETGVGKEVFANRLHTETCPTGPFVALNCSAIPKELIEAELFGYADGAFTGSRRGGAPGKISLADGGTLFLDEVGDMPLELQTRLLRTLQSKSVSRIGEHTERPVDFRLISASHRNIEARVSEGSFREDLYYRLNGVTVVLPALRDRKDKKELVHHLLACISPGVAKTLCADVEALVERYTWPGNIRQLEQALRVAVILSTECPVITLSHFAPDMREKLSRVGTVDLAPPVSLKDLELRAVRRALDESGGNVSAAAAKLGISRSTFYLKLKEADN